MAQIKRQLNDNFDQYDNYKRQKIQTSTDQRDCSLGTAISHFEDLSNELFYEIFEYLNYFHVYQAFSNLNQRFYDLIINSNLPIKINLSSMSKSTLKQYNEDIIKPNTHRVVSLYYSDLFSYNFILLPFPQLSEFQRLETLILYNIEVECLEKMLDQLTSLSLLSSLVITSVRVAKNGHIIYRQIFRLSALKYCKVSLPGWLNENMLPFCTDQYSSIEHLVIVNGIFSDQLDRLLSYVPQLRRLSINLLTKYGVDTIKSLSSQLNLLTHVSFHLSSANFDQLVYFFKYVSPNVEVLYIKATEYFIDPVFIDADNWKQLILNHIPKLRILNFLFDTSVRDVTDLNNIQTKIDAFTSPFWIERQWLFTYHIYPRRYNNRLVFYSINPYRNKHYTLYKQTSKTSSLYEHGSNFNSVQHVHIESGESITSCTNYFPNATEIIFEDGFTTNHASIVTILNPIIPLKQLTKLVIKCSHFSVQRLIKILCHTPNIHTLELKSMPCYKQQNNYTSIQYSQDFQLVSNRNIIKKVTCDVPSKLEQIKLLVTLCPRLEHLTINRRVRHIESIIRFLLDRTNPYTRHLCSLGFTRAWNNWSDTLEQLIKSESLLNDYTLQLIHWHVYLWW